jgi:pyruvate formate lyase activating enzyme
MSPQEFVDETIIRGCQGTSISFNEPTLSLEWSLEVFRLAKEGGLYNTYVTNGYMTEEALNLLIEAGLDGMNVDIKGSKEAVRRYCKADGEVVWRNCCLAKERGVHLEVTTLVIPGVNDDEEGLRAIAARIRDQLGEETPWHLSGYFPAYKFHQPPTSLTTLERGWKIGKEEGLRFVYLGNVPAHRYENTYCPQCGKLLIQRYGLWVTAYRIQKGRCPECERAIPIVGGFTTQRATLS